MNTVDIEDEVLQDDPLACDDCSEPTPDPWHASKGNIRHYHRCDLCHARALAEPTTDWGTGVF